MINGLRRRGFAVTLFSPDELCGFDCEKAEDVMAQHAEDAIKLLGNNQEDRNGEAKSDFETPDDEPVCHRCTVNIEDGILHLENGDSANLLNIVEACMTAYCETGSYKYMESADEVGKIAGLMKGPHGQWITAR